METERLLLRPFTGSDEDVANVYGLNGDPAVMRYLDGGRPTTPEEIRRDVLPELVARPAWAAHERDGGRFVGWFSVRPRPNPVEGGAGRPAAALGYRLRRDAWGRGYATEGARLMVRHAFTELGAELVVAQTMTVNAASRRVMEKAGLRYARTFFEEWPEVIEGSEHGDVWYALTREEWDERIRSAGTARGRRSS